MYNAQYTSTITQHITRQPTQEAHAGHPPPYSIEAYSTHTRPYDTQHHVYPKLSESLRAATTLATKHTTLSTSSTYIYKVGMKGNPLKYEPTGPSASTLPKPTQVEIRTAGSSSQWVIVCQSSDRMRAKYQESLKPFSRFQNQS